MRKRFTWLETGFRRRLIAPVAALCLCLLPHATVQADILPNLKEATRLLASDISKAETIYAELYKGYAGLSADDRNGIDFLGAKIEVLRGNTAPGVTHLEQLLDRQLNNDLYIDLNIYLAGVYSLLNRFDDAFKAQLTALSALKADTDSLVVMEALSRSAYMSTQAGSYDEALEYAERLRLMASESNNSRYLCRAMTERGMAKTALNRLPEAEADLLEAREHCNDAGENNSARLASHHLARAWIAMGEYGKAVTMLERLEKFITAENFWAIGVADNEYLLASALIEIGDWDKARYVATKALKLGQEIQYPMAVREASHVLAKVQAHDGDYAGAYKSLTLHLAASKDVADETAARALAYSRAHLQLEEKGRQIRELQRENRMLALEQALSAQERRNGMILAAAAVVLILILSLFLFRQFRQRSLFRHLAETDSLTGISSRLHVLVAGETLAQACDRAGDRLGIILFDMDNFKAINDAHGRSAGDWALRAVADACKAHLRSRDIFGRYGGEEFILLCRDMTPASAVQLAERCRQAIAGIETGDSGALFDVTASFGVAVSGVDENGIPKPIELEALIREADEALYQAKTTGQNKVVDAAVAPQCI